MGPISVAAVFFFFQVPKLTKPSEKKKKKTRIDRTIERKEKKGKKRIEQPTKRRKEKKSQKWSKVTVGYCLVLFVGPLYVFNYNIVIEL